MDGLIITSTIDAHEERDVATVDVQGVFLWTLNDEKILMLLKGKVVELLVKLWPDLYQKYVIYGKKMVSQC